MLKRDDITPGAQLHVKPGHTLHLDAHRIAWNEDREVGEFAPITVVRGPRKVDRINLVCVQVYEREFEVFYCDILKDCEHAPGV